MMMTVEMVVVVVVVFVGGDVHLVLQIHGGC